MHASYCKQGLGHLEATSTFSSSSSAALHPHPHVRRARRVLYPPHQSRRLPVREDPDQACRWLLLLSALVLLQIFTEETHTCPGRIKNINEITLAIMNLCLSCNLGFSAIFFSQQKETSWLLLLTTYRSPESVPEYGIITRTVMAAWTQLRHGQERNPGFSLGLHHQKLSISAGCPEGRTFKVFYVP